MANEPRRTVRNLPPRRPWAAAPLDASASRTAIREAAWQHAGILRDAASLQAGVAALRAIEEGWQPAPAPSTDPKEEPKPASPLMIEWQGDRYVRRTETSGTSTRNNQPDYIAEAKPHLSEKHPNAFAAQPATTSPSPELSPATFVFHDGHREQSSDYSIISGVIYARGDYWTNGYWAKQIPVSQLDLPATFKANQERGVPFRLPAASNEVITRP